MEQVESASVAMEPEAPEKPEEVEETAVVVEPEEAKELLEVEAPALESAAWVVPVKEPEALEATTWALAAPGGLEEPVKAPKEPAIVELAGQPRVLETLTSGPCFWH